MSAHLILTIDYELFGDGKGCMDACVLQPAERMLRIAEKFSAPLTFFIEVLEFIAFAEKLGDSRAIMQMRAAVQRGHDAQLHLHPQWQRASIVNNSAAVAADSEWIIDQHGWRIGDLDADEILALIRLGKNWLENEIAANVANYRSVAFRAGGWCIQPSHHVVAALRNSGFKLDSTVAPQQWRAARGEWSDFRGAPDLPFWKTNGDVCAAESDGLWEIPIAVGNIGRLHHLRNLLRNRNQPDAGMAPGCRGSYRGTADRVSDRLRVKSARLAQLGKVMLDFSTLPAADLIRVTRQWLKQYGAATQPPIPIVAIAHTKNFNANSERALAEYLAWAQREGLQLSTYGNWLQAVESHEHVVASHEHIVESHE